MKQYSSIFNDVLGPVMCGPSSSHTAASVRIGRLAAQTISGKIVKFTALFDKYGTIASCCHEQGVDIGLVGGLLGMEAHDMRIFDALELAEKQGIKPDFVITEFPNNNPNTYKLIIENEESDIVHFTALSLGGGSVEIIDVEDIPLSVSGGFYETLLFLKPFSEGKYTSDFEEKFNSQLKTITQDLLKKTGLECNIILNSNKCIETGTINLMIQIQTEKELDFDFADYITAESGLNEAKVERKIRFSPVLPITSQTSPHVPFENAHEMLRLASERKMSVWELAVYYESVRGGISEEETTDKMRDLVKMMKRSLDTGLAGTYYEKRILGCQSKYFEDENIRKTLIPDDIVNEIIKCVSAIMEVKSSMNVFVAAPTAGSCGGLTGTTLAVGRKLGASDDDLMKAMFAAGIIGVFISEKATFAAELAGCQAECGSGSGMTAAALTQLAGGNADQVCSGASMALQNVFGMTCDPVAMMVEVPCLGKNIMAGMNALSSANMALAGFAAVIPLDETIYAFNEVGRMMPQELKCTGRAGLTQTKAAKDIEKQFA